MPEAYVDTSVLIRLVTGDNVQRQAASAGLLERVQAGELKLAIPVTVVSEAAYVLTSRSVYGLPRAEVSAILSDLIALDGLMLEGKQTVARALAIFGTHNVDFGDAMIVASMEADGATELYTYDRDFARFEWINRLEPPPARD
jgi:predicted nucleic acid-binding protein